MSSMTNLPTSLVRLLWPYVGLWIAVASALGAYTWYELAAAQDSEDLRVP